MAGKLHTVVSERRHSHDHYPVGLAATTAAEYDRVQVTPVAERAEHGPATSSL
jgi:hypothetical protein